MINISSFSQEQSYSHRDTVSKSISFINFQNNKIPLDSFSKFSLIVICNNEQINEVEIDSLNIFSSKYKSIKILIVFKDSSLFLKNKNKIERQYSRKIEPYFDYRKILNKTVFKSKSSRYFVLNQSLVILNQVQSIIELERFLDNIYFQQDNLIDKIKKRL